MDKLIEHQWIQFTGKNKLSNILIGIFYQPSTDYRYKLQWLDRFESLLFQIIVLHQGPIIITGDFNIDMLKTTREREIYMNILDTFNLKQHVIKPTRKSKTLIDHVASNLQTKLIASDVIMCDENSDHDAPFCIFKVAKPRYEPRYKYLRDEKTFVLNDYINDFRQLPLNIVYA